MADKENRTIEDDVNDNADLLIDRINSEIQYIKDKEITAFKAELNDKINSYREAELGGLNSKVASSESQAKINSQRDLLKLRRELVSSLFNKVKNQITDFRNSNEYADYLKGKLQKNKIDYSKGYFVVRQEDIQVFKDVIKELEIVSEVKTDNDILLGGFRFRSVSMNIMFDETLDSNLNDQKEWFQNESGFII